MKVRYTKYFPLKGYVAINLFGFVFARKEYAPISSITINHEAIHSVQMKEMLYIFFYLCYGIEWVIRLMQYRNSKQAYRNISFEREAYSNESNQDYLQSRKVFSFMKYL